MLPIFYKIFRLDSTPNTSLYLPSQIGNLLTLDGDRSGQVMTDVFHSLIEDSILKAALTQTSTLTP